MRDNFGLVVRYVITLLIFAFYIAFVFFSFTGNYEFLLTFDYYFTTLSTTSVAIFLRWMYSDRGVEVELENNDKIVAKEQAKSNLVKNVIDNDLVGELEEAIIKKNKDNKLKAYRTKCDKKVNHLKTKSWYKFNRKKRLKKWRDKKQETYDSEFNVDTVKVTYYRFDLDEMLSSFYKEPNDNRNKRSTKNGKVIGSFKMNVFTIVAIALVKGAEVLFTDFTREDVVVLISQLVTFFLNIYSGYNLGKKFIKNDYSSNLSEDYTFLSSFLKQNKKVGV
jgi:hypothetical protein